MPKRSELDDLPSITTTKWKNTSHHNVVLVVGHGEGDRGRPRGAIRVAPGGVIEIEDQYASAVPKLAPHLRKLSELGEEAAEPSAATEPEQSAPEAGKAQAGRGRKPAAEPSAAT